MRHNNKLRDLSIGEKKLPKYYSYSGFYNQIIEKTIFESYKTKYASAILVNHFGKPTWPQNIRARKKTDVASNVTYFHFKML